MHDIIVKNDFRNGVYLFLQNKSSVKKHATSFFFHDTGGLYQVSKNVILVNTGTVGLSI